jgi:hypothetical protein
MADWYSNTRLGMESFVQATGRRFLVVNGDSIPQGYGATNPSTEGYVPAILRHRKRLPRFPGE